MLWRKDSGGRRSWIKRPAASGGETACDGGAGARWQVDALRCSGAPDKPFHRAVVDATRSGPSFGARRLETHPPIATKIRRTDATIEDLVVSLRRELKDTSDLGEYGARAIHRELVVRAHEAAPPSVRTVGRILERRGALDGKRRIRRTKAAIMAGILSAASYAPVCSLA